MQIKGNISILVSRDGATIEIQDDQARIQFVEIKLTAEQFTACLGRLAMVPCTIEVKGMDRVGKTHEHKTFDFEIPLDLYNDRHNYDKNAPTLQALANAKLSDGWVADGYFGGRDSFYKNDNGCFAQVTIRRWV